MLGDCGWDTFLEVALGDSKDWDDSYLDVVSEDSHFGSKTITHEVVKHPSMLPMLAVYLQS